ncbi:hypothetical protein GQ43DRAFT_442061 [Delitschia confertaspora ATCC 74209]|uniref:Glycosyltransferase 2 n=1 Tax=Delitschia confertaspora ATCC 74209 TaxID=1513339 RepID=A0A9P4JKE9_9PLEO|nr:hypothetical protein GQ43DRAFT_442061 [Delitschia confertaspora ATCC 74209]
MLGRTLFATDEELGKRDDDHKPKRSHPYNALRAPLRWRRRRILVTVVVLYLFYLVIRNFTAFGNGDGQFLSMQPVNDQTSAPTSSEEPTGAPPGIKAPRDNSPPSTSYSGAIRFYKLAPTLHEAASLGYRGIQKNVLFPVSNLKSASALIPMACEMGRRKRNRVHVALMGRSGISMDDLLEINGVDKEECAVMFHDARPDYPEYSSEQRAEAAVASAMRHIFNYISPYVAIMDDSLREDAFFVRGMRRKSKELDIPIIEIPPDQAENLMWMTRLDARSLRSWHKPAIDMLIQAPSHSSGSLIRLLKSLQKADYSGLKPPRLTIELPAEIDPPTKQYLENFLWPPVNALGSVASSQVILRHRIASQRITQEESAIRSLELFYPASATDSHVLLLSPQAELSPLYYHYVMYTLLEYKYGMYNADVDSIMGISLDLPFTLLDGKSTLKTPGTADMRSLKYTDMSDIRSVPFLWQAPNSHAALYFGDKWVQLHSFLSNRVAKLHQGLNKSPRAKLVSETLPAWTEYMLELMRTRGLSLLYPAASSGDRLVTIHNELYRRPEEFEVRQPEEHGKGSYTPLTSPPTEPFLTAEQPPPKPQNYEPPLVPYSRPLHLTLPFDAELPSLAYLPYLSQTGHVIPLATLEQLTETYATRFREDIGGCDPLPKGRLRKVEPMSARDLFCFGDEREEDFEDKATGDGDWDPFGLKKSTEAMYTATDIISDASEATPTPTSPSIVVESPAVTAPAEPRDDLNERL